VYSHAPWRRHQGFKIPGEASHATDFRIKVDWTSDKAASGNITHLLALALQALPGVDSGVIKLGGLFRAQN
jgi:hypothetical protein